MLTTAITAAITAVLAFLGIAPKPELVGAIWLAVKLVIVGLGLWAGDRLLKKRKAPAQSPNEPQP